MRRVLLLALAPGLLACRPAGTAAPAPSIDCEIVVAHTADGRSGTAGCVTPSPTPRVAGTQEPPKGKEGNGKGKGRD